MVIGREKPRMDVRIGLSECREGPFPRWKRGGVPPGHSPLREPRLAVPGIPRPCLAAQGRTGSDRHRAAALALDVRSDQGLTALARGRDDRLVRDLLRPPDGTRHRSRRRVRVHPEPRRAATSATRATPDLGDGPALALGQASAWASPAPEPGPGCRMSVRLHRPGRFCEEHHPARSVRREVPPVEPRSRNATDLAEYSWSRTLADLAAMFVHLSLSSSTTKGDRQ